MFSICPHNTYRAPCVYLASSCLCTAVPRRVQAWSVCLVRSLALPSTPRTPTHTETHTHFPSAGTALYALGPHLPIQMRMRVWTTLNTIHGICGAHKAPCTHSHRALRMHMQCRAPAPALSIPSGFLVVFEKPNRSSFTFTFTFYNPLSDS